MPSILFYGDEILLLTTEVKTKWNTSTKRWYIGKGYIFTKIGDELTVKTNDLKETSLVRIKAKCDICGKVTETSYGSYRSKDNFDGKDYCRHCIGIKINKSLLRKYGTTDTLSLGNNREKVLAKHRNSYEYVRNTFEEAGYKLVSKEYHNCTEKLQFICPKHGLREISFRALTYGQGCNLCRSSKGEAKIRKILTELGITFSEQYTFPDLKTTRLLRFDFCIFNDDDKSIRFLLEYQGEQHYRLADYAGKGREWAEKNLIRVKELDRLKRLYCKSHRIPLVSIKYTQKNNLDKIIGSLILLKGGE